jgi:hypothetical protein
MLSIMAVWYFLAPFAETHEVMGLNDVVIDVVSELHHAHGLDLGFGAISHQPSAIISHQPSGCTYRFVAVSVSPIFGGKRRRKKPGNQSTTTMATATLSTLRPTTWQHEKYSYI